MGELERELEAVQAELDRALARAEDADRALQAKEIDAIQRAHREGVTP